MTTRAPAAIAPRRMRVPALLAEAVDSGLAIWLVVAVAAVASALLSPIFLTTRNISNLLNQLLLLGLAAVGQTFAVLAGAIDLSVGSTAKLTAVLTPGLIDGHGGRVVPVILLMLLLGAGVGLLNGLVITRLGVNPFIVTLGMFIVLRGVALGYTTEPVGSVPSGVVDAMYYGVGPFPTPFLVFAGLSLAMIWVLRATVFGRRVYAVGGDQEIARMAGIGVNRVTVAVMIVCAVFAALAGVSQGLRTGIGSPTAAEGLELSAITAVVLGGSSLFGGRGRLVGTLGGVLLLSLIDNAINLNGVSSFYQGLVRGVVLVSAVAIFTRKE
jgi:ribose transport system permease protein